MSTQHNYSINLDVKFDFLELIDIRRLAAACTEQWFNQTLCRVNDCVIRLGVMQGEFHWHKHDQEDEFFFVLEGQFLIDLESGTAGQPTQTIMLQPQQGFTIPKGVVHRTRAPERAVILMVEQASVRPTGDRDTGDTSVN
jgi:mannose-6-phosphate isomerase-like protein (cupin superfamily)